MVMIVEKPGVERLLAESGFESRYRSACEAPVKNHKSTRRLFDMTRQPGSKSLWFAGPML